MVDADATRTAFSGLIEKPALTDALLNRPPFKFILDVISNTVSTTGYLKAQFPKEDLDPNKLSDKTAKCEFLDKFISAVNDGSLNHVKAAKIVAGKEPEATSMLLRAFAANAAQFKANKPGKTEKRSSSKSKESKSSSKERTKSHDKKEAEEKENKKDLKKEKKSSRTKSKEPRESKKDSSKSKEKKPEDKVRKSSKSSKEKKKKEEDSVTAEVSEPSTSDVTKHAEANDEGFSDQVAHTSNSDNQKDVLLATKPDDSGISDISESPRPPPPNEREQTRLGTAAARPMTSMGRPGTAAARPAPPKLKKKHIATTEEATFVAQEPAADILTEAEPVVEENFMIEEPVEEESPLADDVGDVEIEGEVGGLVQKMMETKAELEEGLVEDDIEMQDGEYTKQKAKVETLQKTLQNVTRTTYPLARLFDYAQEDLESMIRELERWRAETRSNESELKDREASGHGDAHKLSNALHQLDSEIRDVKSNLSAAKGRIVANDERIQLLVAGL